MWGAELRRMMLVSILISMDESVSRPALLKLLHATIHDDNAPSGLSGSVCIGVEQKSGGLQCWLGVFDQWKVFASFVPSIPDGVDAALVLGCEDELHVMGRGGPGFGSSVRVFGDKNLLRRLFERYLARNTVLSVRVRSKSK